MMFEMYSNLFFLPHSHKAAELQWLIKNEKLKIAFELVL